MLVAPGGGGSGTNWFAMTVLEMQDIIQKPDTDKHYELLTGWKQSADLINEHRWQVQNYRDNLAAVWPPEKNEAAYAYLTRLDDLIKNLDETYEAAIANHDAFASATLSISLAQNDVQKIYDEYMANAQLMNDFNAKQQQAEKADPGITSTEKPPVADGRQEELRQKAASLLSSVSSDLALAQVNIRTPTPYRPLTTRDATTGGSDENTYIAPPLPPITPAFGSTGGSAPSGPTSSSSPSAVFPTLPAGAGTQPVVGSPITVQPGSGTPQPGLILGGTPTSPVTTPPPSIAPPQPTLPSGTPGPITGPGLLPTTGPGFLPSGGTTPLPPVANGSGRAGAGLPREGALRPGTPTGAPHVMPPGGMIGGTPGVSIGQPGAARPGVSRVNPVGGVIGGGVGSNAANASGIASQRASQVGGPYGQTTGRGPKRGEGAETNRWDPDNPWETASGVDPVVLPPRAQRVDPGPAIGLN
ncbi:hypothetical protein Ade02nite_49610 [Paractinoplanes deccanensis]|uniref:Uncharacterized protein n=1 Tax=Paractinoplanes deccanensis TaxID=113561 RepID=A0ABQ3Y903_9ACTN|nr:hypothetical protein [Actinoplanes deccanensis]GID76320.1 hypothetical protein Ade02nite_49610 [Actinoplanes deccanensis]